MLFDLRGRHRRRAVRIIYIGLALLMGVGLVGFGVGGGFGGGGLLNAASSNEGSGGATYSSEIKKYTKLTTAQPSNASAWEHLVSAQLHEGGNESYVSQSGVVTSKGKELFHQVARSWSSYMALNPPKPNVELAKRMLAVYGEEGLNEPAAAVQVLQIAVAAEPTSAALYADLAEYAYRAHNTRVGDLASAKAISLAPAAQRPRLRTELISAKKNAEKAGTTGATGTTSSGTLTTGASTTSTPTGTSSTTTK
jgi:hypothetical protein